MSSVIKFICYICGNICNKLSRVISETENVMIGKLIPAGTGMKQYRNIEVDYGENEPLMRSSYEENEEGNVSETASDKTAKLEGLNEDLESLAN